MSASPQYAAVSVNLSVNPAQELPDGISPSGLCSNFLMQKKPFSPGAPEGMSDFHQAIGGGILCVDKGYFQTGTCPSEKRNGKRPCVQHQPGKISQSVPDGWRGSDRWFCFGKGTQKFYHWPQELDDDQYCPWSPGKCSHLQHYRNSQGEWVKCVLLYQASVGAVGMAYRWSGKYRTIRTETSYATVKGPAGWLLQ